jgi:penicillin amidase
MMRPKLLQRLLAGAGLGCGLALGIWLGVSAQWERRAARAAYPRVEGRIALGGLDAPVVIRRDAHGVAHIRAETDADAFRGLGFSHAQDRLSQMVWLVHSARGRAAELVGRSALPSDRIARTLGIAHHAERQAAGLDPDALRALQAYAEGVNAQLDRIRAGEAKAPPELRRLGFLPDAWTPADTIAVVKLHAWALGSTLEASLVLSDLIERLGGFGARPFFRGPDAYQQIPLPAEARFPTPPSPGARAPFRDALRRSAGLAGRNVGSSAWVVGGELAARGRPLLAADAHHEATAPALYYEAHWTGDRMDVAGVTIPGVPVAWIGQNHHVVWAGTHAGAVVTDLYVETLDPRDPSRYHVGDGWRELEVREERIRVRGGDDEVLVVRETRHGPLLNPLIGEGREPLALAWTGARAGGIRGMLRAAHAHSADEFRDALAHHLEPVLNFAYADAKGAGGRQVAGWIPRRSLVTGLAPVPGRTHWYDWSGPVAFDELPLRTLSPTQPFVIAADNPPAGEGYEGPIEWVWRSGERAERIAQLLAELSDTGKLDIRSLVAMQSDVRSVRAHDLIETALAFAEEIRNLEADEARSARLLRRWDGVASANSVGAAVYHVFLDELTRELLGPWLGEALLERYLAVPQADPQQVVATLLEAVAVGSGAPSALGRDRARAAVLKSFRTTWLRLSVREGPNPDKWQWGRLHALRFRPLLPRARPQFLRSGLGPFPYYGDGVTIAAGEFDPSDPFETRVASTYRFAVDAAELDEALTSLAPGQSGHPGHRHETDGVERWIAGRPTLLLTSALLVDEGAASVLLLEPLP